MAGRELVQFVQDLVEKGNVRRIIIKTKGGKTVLDLPLTAGAVVGGAAAILAPTLAVIGGLAALLAEVKVEIERDEEPVQAEVVEEAEEPADA